MTERWRKKLGDLDKAGPGEDVFERAHEGPAHPDDVIPLPKTSTRVVTGAAAFLVFALAISVFAIPVLRMNDGPASPGSSGLLPLWPARSLDDLESLQQRADSGEADAVWALDLEQVAGRFASDVLGWDAVRVLPDQGIVIEECSSIGACGITVECSYTSGEQVCPGFTYASPSGNPYVGGPSTAAPSPYQWRTLRFGGDCERDRCPRDVGIRLFQPLEVGEGAIWTVLSASSEQNSLSVTTGEALRYGDEIFGGVTLVDREVPAMAYHVGPGTCDVDDLTSTYTTTRGSLAGREQAGLTLPIQHGCTEPSPGYVWLATANESLVRSESGPIDPFIAGGQVQLQSLTAVPVTFLPAAPDGGSTVQVTTPPTISTSPTPDVERWSTYTADPEYGWTIEHPDTWSADPIEAAVRFSSPNGSAVMKVAVVRNPPSDDDSTFPLDPDNLQSSIHSFTFRGDGQMFAGDVVISAADATLSPEDRQIVEEMIRSISFEPWEQGETRHGWTAVGRPPEVGAEWALFDGNIVIAHAVRDGFTVIDTPDACGGEQDVAIEQGWPVLRCPDGTTVSYNDHGLPDVANPAEFQEPALVYPAIQAHDGHLLVQLL